MTRARLATLRFLSLLLLLPGLAGLILSAMVSTHYLNSLPTSPAPEQLRMTPRSIDGKIIYQTADEDRRLSTMEFSSVGVFLAGLVMGLVYLEKWSELRSEELDEQNRLADQIQDA